MADKTPDIIKNFSELAKLNGSKPDIKGIRARDAKDFIPAVAKTPEELKLRRLMKFQDRDLVRPILDIVMEELYPYLNSTDKDDSPSGSPIVDDVLVAQRIKAKAAEMNILELANMPEARIIAAVQSIQGESGDNRAQRRVASRINLKQTLLANPEAAEQFEQMRQTEEAAKNLRIAIRNAQKAAKEQVIRNAEKAAAASPAE
jgi:isoleucyl-tRNA synthetase